jgi:hypothetical protein
LGGFSGPLVKLMPDRRIKYRLAQREDAIQIVLQQPVRCLLDWMCRWKRPRSASSEHGKIIKEGKAAGEPEALARWIGGLHGTIAAVGVEAGPLSQWLHHGLTEAGLDVLLM